MLVGYARVSAEDPGLSFQKEQLRQAGCSVIYKEQPGKTQPVLDNAISSLRRGDMLVVCSFVRLGRNLRELVNRLVALQKNGADFRSLKEDVDTRGMDGRLVFHVFALLAGFEREIMQGRTYAGRGAARARGRNGGRPKKLTAEFINKIVQFRKNDALSVSEICDALKISRQSYYNALSNVRG